MPPTRPSKTADADTDAASVDSVEDSRQLTTTSCSTAHFITGDGRGNENIGLTAVHHVFHAEHNRQVDAIKATDARQRRRRFIMAAAGATCHPAGSCGTASACSRRRSSPPRCSISTSCSRNSRARSSRISTNSLPRFRRDDQSGDRRRVRARRLSLRPLDADRDGRSPRPQLQRHRQSERLDPAVSRSA